MKYLLIPLFILLTSLLASAQTLLPFDKYFREADVTGSFSLYDLGKKQYFTTDKAEFRKATSPASTFKVPNTFIALEEKAIRDENEVLKWDGTQRMVPAWNQDNDLKMAYKNSTVWFYQELARRIGADKYKSYLKRLDYGNREISGGLTQFWLGTSLKISPEEQLKFLQKVHNESLPFSERTYRIGKEIMVEEKTDAYTLRAKTGWAEVDPSDIGWYIGYVESKGNVYFFATRIYKPLDEKMDDFGPKRKTITRQILHDLTIL
ncbi:class D beta-lactamase [Telluribacter sp.]|jgi:beta-lactamase class D|uniref:class D beta-lactamase n=1 Tax=Telluribacter sp. TaxID=1978767 RepID=UPI002E0FC6F0|nr:class D beta-lactamase [Telluribacter sp.]